MANSKSGYNAVGQAPGPRSNKEVSPSRVLDGAARAAKTAARIGDRVPAAPASTTPPKSRPGGTKGQHVGSRKGTANISRPGR